MSEYISGIPKVGPAYPIKPAQPAQKDREPGKRHKKERNKPKTDERHGDDKRTIDEHV